MPSLSRRMLGVLMAGVVGAAFTGAALAADALPTKPEPGTFKIGVEPWLGYGQWHVAAEKKLYAANGLTSVDVVNFTEDKDINAALASGQLDGASIATHTAMGMVAAGLPVKIVLLLDVSMTADAIISTKGVDTIKDLKGKQVAFEEGTTSDILLKYALSKNGMTVADIQPVPMPAADAGSALIAGRVPVAVTYEPYLTAAKAQSKDVKLLFAAAEDPGLISDVFVVREEVLKSKPGQVVAMIKSWNAALDAYKADTKGARAIIAKAVGSPAEELDTAFDGVRYFSTAENVDQLSGDFAKKTFDDVKAAAKSAGLLQADVTADKLIDARFATAAK